MSEKILATYGADYGGLLSNSQLQAAIVCPVKYKLMYVDGIRPDKDGFYWNAAFIGNVLHRAIELHDNDQQAIKDECWAILAAYFPQELVNNARNLMAVYNDAIAATCREFKHKNGRPCKAPEMTGFWKKTYAGLDEFLSRLNKEMEESIPGGVFEDPFVELIKRMQVCITNWERMRIDAPVASEIQLSGVIGPPDAQVPMVGTADRLESRRDGRIALADFKTGKWAYDRSKVQNSDQFGLYHRLLERSDYGAPVEWVVYNLFTGETVVVAPNEAILAKFDARMANNLRYFKQLQSTFDVVEVPTPAGSAFKTGCPCLLAYTNDCPYVYLEESK